MGGGSDDILRERGASLHEEGSEDDEGFCLVSSASSAAPLPLPAIDREHVRAYLHHLQDDFSRLLSGKGRQGDDDEAEEDLLLSDFDFVVKQGSLSLIRDYCMLGHSTETGEATLALAIRHAAPPSSAPAMVSFLVGAPMDSPVTKAAVMQALEWTREQQGCMSVLEALFSQGAGRGPVLGADCEPVDAALLSCPPIAEDRRGLAVFLMSQHPGFRPSLRSLVSAVRAADLGQLAWLKEQVSPLSLSEVEEAAGGKARGELVLEALRAGEGLVLHWLLEEGQAALPDRLEAEDYQRMVARGQLAALRWLSERGLEADGSDGSLVQAAITTCLTGPQDEDEDSSSSYERAERDGLELLTWLLQRGCHVDGPVAMQTLLSTGEVRPGRAAEVLRVLLEARPDCLDVVVTTTKMKAPALSAGIRVESRSKQPQPQHRPLCRTPSSPFLEGRRVRQSMRAFSGQGYPLSSSPTSPHAEDHDEEAGGFGAMLPPRGGPTGYGGGSGGGLCMAAGLMQPLRTGVVLEASTSLVKVRWDDGWVETQGLAAFQSGVVVQPQPTPTSTRQSGRPLWLHRCVSAWLELPCGHEDGGRLLQLARVLMDNGHRLDALCSESWELLLRHPRGYAALIAPALNHHDHTTTTQHKQQAEAGGARGGEEEEKDVAEEEEQGGLAAGGGKGVGAAVSVVGLIRRAPSIAHLLISTADQATRQQ